MAGAESLGACANGDGPAAVLCAKCRLAFCARCTPRTVNGDPWCEGCTRALVDEIEPRWLLGLVVLAAGMGIVWYVVGEAVQHALAGLRPLRSVRLHIGAMVIPVAVAWVVTFPIFGGDKPRVERR